MYFKTSLKAWQNYMYNTVNRMKWEKDVELERSRYKMLGKEYSEPVYPEPPSRFEEVEIEREVTLEMSCDSDEMPDEVESKSRKPGHQPSISSMVSLGGKAKKNEIF